MNSYEEGFSLHRT